MEQLIDYSVVYNSGDLSPIWGPASVWRFTVCVLV